MNDKVCFVCSSVVSHPARDYFSPQQTLTYGIEDLYRATPAVTRGLGFLGLTERTTIQSYFTTSEEYRGPLIQIPSG